MITGLFIHKNGKDTIFCKFVLFKTLYYPTDAQIYNS